MKLASIASLSAIPLNPSITTRQLCDSKAVLGK